MKSEYSANQALAQNTSNTQKMAKIQNTDTSFKFRLGAMLALKPISSTFHRKA